MKKLFYFTITALIMITACQPKTQTSAVDTRADADTIRSLEDQWIVAYQAKDLEKIVGLFASDGIQMLSNKPIVIGLEAVRKAEESSLSDTTYLVKTYTSTTDNVEVSASGDLAYARGSDRINRSTAKGPEAEVGKWIDIWKKVDGKWKVMVSIWNSDNPPPKQ